MINLICFRFWETGYTTKVASWKLAKIHIQKFLSTLDIKGQLYVFSNQQAAT